MASMLEQLKLVSTVVADTGDFELMRKYKTTDVTTNPSLIFAAATIDKYRRLVTDALEYGAGTDGGLKERVAAAMDKLYVNFGVEILNIIPGRVSTEIDPRLSYDVDAQITKAKKLVQLYKLQGIDKKRVLIKICSTKEGIQAARILEADYGIHCNMTLLFSFKQALACAEADVTLVSPFVGRVLDWYKANTDTTYCGLENHPGVKGVARIYNYYKRFGYRTEVMPASLRTIGEIAELAGIDNMTISPKLLDELSTTRKPVTRKLSKASARAMDLEATSLKELAKDEPNNESMMAIDKVTDGIRIFSADVVKLENLLRKQLALGNDI